MKKILLAAVAALVVSCGMEEVSRRPPVGGDGVWTGQGMNSGSGNSGKRVTYVTALDYPDGYDWRTDVEKGSVKCSLVVYADGIPAMKVAVGDEYEVSSDPDMHRMIGGHLYSDFSSDSTTVIKRDGKELVRYDGREMISGLVENGGYVYTLGDSRQGSGFSFRRDGEVILKRDRGSSFGALHHVGDTVSFAFREPVAAVDGLSLERYYHVVNGDVRQAAVREDVKKVWDIAMLGGETYYLASVVGIPAPVLFRGESMRALAMPGSSDMLTCRLLPEDGTMYVEGLCVRDGKSLAGGMWDDEGRNLLLAEGMTISSIFMEGDGICCLMNASSPYHDGIIYRCGETYPMPSGYSSIGSGSAIVINGILHAGLSSFSGGPPIIWRDGKTDTLNVNGFISSISTN